MSLQAEFQKERERVSIERPVMSSHGPTWQLREPIETPKEQK